MVELINLVIFIVEDQRYALPLKSIVRIVNATEVTKLPNAPDGVLGIINFQSEIIPVLNLRQRLNLPEREINPTHHFLIALTAKRKVALFIDRPQDVIEIDQSLLVDSDHFSSDIEQIQGVIKLNDGLVLIYNLEKLLSPGDVLILDEALSQLT
jgi:purine-binding chemotaxis protein CheW